MQVCDGNVIDNDWAYSKVYEFISRFNLHSIAFNLTLSTHDVVQALIRANVSCNPISQGYRTQSLPTKAWEEMLTAGEIDHLNNPVLAWQNLNTQIARSKDGEVRIQKMQGMNSGIAAAIQAIAQWKTISSGIKEDDGLLESW